MHYTCYSGYFTDDEHINIKLYRHLSGLCSVKNFIQCIKRPFIECELEMIPIEDIFFKIFYDKVYIKKYQRHELTKILSNDRNLIKNYIPIDKIESQYVLNDHTESLYEYLMHNFNIYYSLVDPTVYIEFSGSNFMIGFIVENSIQPYYYNKDFVSNFIFKNGFFKVYSNYFYCNNPNELKNLIHQKMITAKYQQKNNTLQNIPHYCLPYNGIIDIKHITIQSRCSNEFTNLIDESYLVGAFDLNRCIKMLDYFFYDKLFCKSQKINHNECNLNGLSLGNVLAHSKFIKLKNDLFEFDNKIFSEFIKDIKEIIAIKCSKYEYITYIDIHYNRINSCLDALLLYKIFYHPHIIQNRIVVSAFYEHVYFFEGDIKYIFSDPRIGIKFINYDESYSNTLEHFNIRCIYTLKLRYIFPLPNLICIFLITFSVAFVFVCIFISTYWFLTLPLKYMKNSVPIHKIKY